MIFEFSTFKNVCLTMVMIFELKLLSFKKLLGVNLLSRDGLLK